MTVSPFRTQIQNRNFLTPGGFEFSVKKNPKITFFCQTANIPQITLQTAIQSTYLKRIDVPGDVLEYEDFTLSFLVDENFENYMAIHNWMTGLGFPKSTKQFDDLTKNSNGVEDLQEQFSDGTLLVLNSNFRPNFKVMFKDLFPVSLTGLDFDTKLESEEFFTAQVVFKYSIYEVTNLSGTNL
tara:strand:- start:6607 stop:7155 length:549 start_codon:yes stop_codon:yes gene_type:complete